MRTLVTGHTGFVGAHLLRELRGRSRFGELHGLSRNSDNALPDNLDAAWDGDVRNYERVRQVVDRVRPDRIIHLAAQAYVPEGTTNPRRAFDVNVGGALNVLEAVRQTGSRARVLLAGTCAEYGYEYDADVLTEDATPRPTTPYGVSKLAAGHLGLAYATLYGVNVVVTRAWNHTGPGHGEVYAVPSFARQVAEVTHGLREEVLHGNLDAVRSYLDVRDVVRAYALAVDLPTGVYNVCAERVTTMREVLDILCAVAGCDPPRTVDPALYRPGMQRGAGSTPRPSHDKLTAATGWQPTLSLERTLGDTYDYWHAEVARCHR